MKPRALIVDDSVTVRMDLKDCLEEAGIATSLSATVAAARECLAREAFDILILDALLPDGDGFDFLAELKAAPGTRRIPVMLLASRGEVGDRLHEARAGADEYLGKPYDRARVRARALELLRAEPVPGKDEAGDDGSGPTRILAVDDSPTFLEMLSDELRNEGYEVLGARTGEEALRVLADRKADAVLLDVMMPGLSGQETCRRIKSNPAWRDIPLLMLTALDENDSLLEGIDAGADDYIAKSDRFEVLKARLKAQLRRCRFEDENRRFRERLARKEMEALEMEAVRELAEARAGHIEDLERKNGELRRAKEAADALAKELESFSYSVSHDLRAPLRSIDGFSQILMERHAGGLGEEGKRMLGLVREATRKMGELIDDMLGLARVSRREIAWAEVDLSALARETLEDLRRREPERVVEADIQGGIRARGDKGLLRILLENLLGNAWKFTSKAASARIGFRMEPDPGGNPVYLVRDNGAGFDMAYAEKLFRVFQRLHLARDFPGTGVGLATVDRVVKRHGGRVWAEGKPGAGATFYFTLEGNNDEGQADPAGRGQSGRSGADSVGAAGDRGRE